MKQNLGELKAKGAGAFEDSRGRTIVADYKNRRAYIVDKEDDKKYFLFTNRISFAVIVLLLGGFYINWVVGVIAGIAVYAVFEFLYRRFLSGLQTVENVDFPEKLTMYKGALQKGRKTILAQMAMSLAFAILIVVNLMYTVKDWEAAKSFTDPNTTLLIVATVALSLFALYIFVQFTRAFIYKIKNKEK